MIARDLVLALVSVDEIPSRTMLQKLAYFVAADAGLDVSFKPYYYGPYSAELQEELESLVASGIVEERKRTFEPGQSSPFEGVQYSYRLASAGERSNDSVDARVRESALRVVRAAKEAGAWNQSALSLAAKLHHLRKIDPGVRNEQVPELARQLRWQILEESVGYADRLLTLLTEDPRD